jgi:hypothetical protein
LYFVIFGLSGGIIAMNQKSTETIKFTKEFTRPEPIPEAGIKRALELMKSGRLHRYNSAPGEISEVSLLEKEYAEYVGARYCLGLSSCGSSIYAALKSVGVVPGDKVLCNVFTLAPVPGAIKSCQPLPRTRKTLDFMCDFRIPLTFSMEDCKTVAAVIKQVATETF